MKELSIEEKAKAYDKVLEWATEAHKVCDGMLKEDLEHLFPELAESEDERIRKEMLEYCYKRMNNEFPSITIHQVERWLAWLEKQGEHAKFRDSIQVGDKVTRNQYGVLVNLSQLKRVAKPADEKQGEKPNNVYDKELSEILGRVIRRYINDPNIPYTEREKVSMEIIPYVERLERQGKQKPAWSEEDEEMLDTLIANYKFLSKEFRDKEYNFFVEMSLVKEDLDMINWLKSLKDRIQPQPKQEWSGGDEAHLHSLITHLEQWIERHPNTTGADVQGENIAWLKSLRPQSQWKPSEEQMLVLKDALNDAITQYDFKGSPIKEEVTRKHAETIESLYNDLKKLREE